MNLRQLQVFVAIVEEGSLSKAAQKIGAAQPSLSQQIRLLEADLNCQLLVRGPKGAEPTESGRTLLHHARIILGQVNAARAEILSGQKQPVGSVRLGLPGTVASVLALPLIGQIRSQFPGIRLSVAEAMSGDTQSWLRDGRADLGLIYRFADSRLLSATHVLTEELWLIAPSRKGVPTLPQSEISLSEVSRLDLILPTVAQGMRAQLDDIAARENLVLTPQIEIDSATQIKYLVERGMGYAILPLMAVSQERVRGTLKAIRIVDPIPSRNLYLAHSTERPLSNSAVAVQQLVLTMVRSLVESGTWPATLI